MTLLFGVVTNSMPSSESLKIVVMKKKRSGTPSPIRMTRPSKTGSVVRGRKHDSDDYHQPEADERTTPIRKKKRTVDKESLSESDLKIGSDLYYCNIDRVSEAQIVEAVQSINYSIETLTSNILDGVKQFNLSYLKRSRRKHREPHSPDFDDFTLVQFLLDSSSSSWLSDHNKDLVVEYILHNLITSLVYKHFFRGEHFFGVGSETLHEHLETMYSKLVASENSDPITIQRWRSTSVEAVFQMNDGIEPQLHEELITELEHMLKVVFPPSPNRSSKKVEPESSYESIVRGVRQSLLDIIRQARNLSFTIQHEVVSCQLLVTIAAPASANQKSSDDTILGTYAFGLRRILGSERRILIKTRVITSELLRSIYTRG